MLSETDLAIAAVTGVAGFIVLACFVGFCYWRDSQRRSHWDGQSDDVETPARSPGELPPPSLKLRGKALELAQAQAGGPGEPPIVKPLLPTGYQAPSRRLDAGKWRKRGNNAQSKFSKVTGFLEVMSRDSDDALRAYGTLSAGQDEPETATPRSARTPQDSKGGGGGISQHKDKHKEQFGGASSSSTKLTQVGGGSSASLNSKASTSSAPRREGSGGLQLDDDDDNHSQASGPGRERTMSAKTRAALAKAKSAGAAGGRTLVKVKPPPLIDLGNAPMQPTMLGRQTEAQSWPVPGLPPPPRSPLPVQPPHLPPRTPSLPPAPTSSPPLVSPRDGVQDQPTNSTADFSAMQAYFNGRAPAVPTTEAPPPRPPSSLPPPSTQVLRLSTGGDLLDQIELPCAPPKAQASAAPLPQPGRSTSPGVVRRKAARKATGKSPVTRKSESEDEECSSSCSEGQVKPGRASRQSTTPEGSNRENKFDAMDADLSAEIEAEVDRAVALAFDSKALKRNSGGLPCLSESDSDIVPDKGARKSRKSSPKGRKSSPKPRKTSVSKSSVQDA